MAQSLSYDLHDEVLIQADRLSSRYGAPPPSTSLAGHAVRVRCNFIFPFSALISHSNQYLKAVSVAWNHVGDILASSADDGSVHLWSLQDCRRVRLFTFPWSTFTSLTCLRVISL
jgi:WD40 repeat protein